MIATLGFLTVGIFLALTLFTRVSVLISLVLVPIVFAVIGGFTPELGDMIGDGLVQVAPVAIMITFAILYFSLMVDVGLFDPLINKVVGWAKGDPVKIAVGTAIVTMAVALDGDGASTFLITISAFLPIYKRIGMRPLALTGIVALGAGVMNLIPWGGPTARAMAALDLLSSDIFLPMLPAMVGGMIWVVVAAFIIGRIERKRIGSDGVHTSFDEQAIEAAREHAGTPLWKTIINLALTIGLVIILLFQLFPLHVSFIIAFVIALIINRPSWTSQQELLSKHGGNVVLVITMIFAAGVFTGILRGTGMIEAMALQIVDWIPENAGGFLPIMVALASMPLSLVFTPDAFYFGVVPVFAEATMAMGGDPAEIGRAAIVGQMTTGFPLSPLTASTFILIGMAKVSLGDHQRFIFGWAFGTSVVMAIIAVLTGAISI